jgi:endonuclease/exonuclease/phosphatase family metal-dependent hydrolase
MVFGEMTMKIATWNLNNRVGKVTFRPEAAGAAIALGVDVLVFNEYFPKEHEATFARTLHDAGWSHQAISTDTGERANRVFIASRIALKPLEVRLPDFDRQFPSNVLCVSVPSVGISIVGVRIPWHEKQEAGLVFNAWNWLEATAATLLDKPSIILGDLNVGLTSNRSRGGEHFGRILQSGWHRAIPKAAASFYGSHGQQSEIDHILGAGLCGFSNARYVTELDGHLYAGGNDSISDHAALMTEVTVRDVASDKKMD